MGKEVEPEYPSIDRSDLRVMRRAAGIAKRRNNALRAKVPLYADQFPQVTAEDVIRRRQLPKYFIRRCESVRSAR